MNEMNEEQERREALLSAALDGELETEAREDLDEAVLVDLHADHLAIEQHRVLDRHAVQG